jgi:hypothetical protein
MADRWQSRKAFVLVTATLVAAALSSGAAFLAAAPADPSAPGVVLGAEWQCSNMILFTSCTRVRHGEPVAQRVGQAAIPARRV